MRREGSVVVIHVDKHTSSQWPIARHNTKALKHFRQQNVIFREQLWS